MAITDLDGTLLDARSRLSPGNRRALERLGEAGVVRVIATGRSLYSAHTVLQADLPVDYLVFSSGAGVVRWRDGHILARNEMARADALEAIRTLESLEMDFMVHHGVPDTHRFHHTPPDGDGNADFVRRIERYEGYGEPWTGALPPALRVSQLLAIEPPGRVHVVEQVRAALPRLNVVRTTSPLDHASTWIEIFPGHVSKSQTCAWLRETCGLDGAPVIAVGNDHNDDDLLAWAPEAFVVANGVEELKARHGVVASNEDDGFAEAASALLARLANA